jgi:hypothetical protein
VVSLTADGDAASTPHANDRIQHAALAMFARSAVVTKAMLQILETDQDFEAYICGVYWSRLDKSFE